MHHCEPWKSQAIFFLALIFALVCVLAEALYLPSLPHIAQSFDLTGASFESCTWVLYFGCAVSIVFHGFIADYIGRATAIFSGQTLVMAGSLLSIFANDPQEFLLATTVLSLGLGSSVLLCRILARDLFQGALFVQMLSIVSLCTLILTPLAPLIVELVLPRGSWQSLFLVLFTIVAISFVLMHIAFSDHRLRRVVNHQPSKWTLHSLYRPSVLLSLSLALLNAAIVFLYQSAVLHIFAPGHVVYMLAIPPVATLLSTLMFYFTQNWRYNLVGYTHWRQGLSIVLAIFGALSWNVFQNEMLFALCLFAVFVLQSNILSVVTVYLLQDRISIGLSASLVSAIHHGAIGIAILSVPITLRNSPKDLIILIPLLIVLATPILAVAKFLSLGTDLVGQEHGTPYSLSA